MNRIQFTPSYALDQKLYRKALLLGLSRSEICKMLLENLSEAEIDRYLPDKEAVPTFSDLVEVVYAEIISLGKTKKGTQFSLNDLSSFLRVPVTVRSSLGRAIFKRLSSEENPPAAPIVILDGNGLLSYKRRARAMLYVFN